MGDVVDMPQRTYVARAFYSCASGFDLNVAGTLCGGVDLSVSSPTMPNSTYNITPAEARVLASHLLSAADDVERRCLGDRDALLVDR